MRSATYRRGAVSPKVIIVITVLVLLAGLVVFLNLPKSDRADPLEQKQYYVNTSTGELVAIAAKEAAPAGHVVAFVMSCGACDQQNQFVAYIEKMTPEAKAANEQLMAGAPDTGALDTTVIEGTFVASYEEGMSPDKIDWVQRDSGDGVTLMNDASDCDGKPAKTCKP